MKHGLVALVALGLLTIKAIGGEQAGPNPANLSPSGTQGVSLFTGAFTYSYPIVVPPGRRGIQPNLTLLYNSQAQNGWVGLGWDLSLGSIQRSTKNGIPSYNDSQDTFILQFQGATDQLVPIASGSDSTGTYTEYRAQIESSFLRVRYYAPALWVVTSKDGTQYQFEGVGQNTNNSKFFFWGLSEVLDPLGNFMQVSYPSLSSATWSGAPGPGGTPTAIISTGAVVGFMPASISYTGKCTAGTCQTVTQPPLNQITFSYELRPDTMTSAMEGGEQVIVTRLKTIQTTSNGSAVRNYQLTYSTSILGTSLLTAITFMGNDGITSLSTTTFSYQSNAVYSVALSTSYSPLPVDITTAQLLDVNGDGLPDIVQNIRNGASGAWLNTGSGWISSNTWIPPVPVQTSGYEPPCSTDLGVRFGDVNGDGLTDVLQGLTPGLFEGNSEGWLNSGTQWISSGPWSPPIDFADSQYASTGTVLLDVNGDGLADIIQNYHLLLYNGNSDTYSDHYARSAWINTGDGWVQSSTWVPPVQFFTIEEEDVDGERYYIPTYTPDFGGVLFADINGDGLVDILQSNGISSSAWLNNGNGWSLAPQWLPPVAFLTGAAGSSQDNGVRIVDINGDGLPDLVQYSTGPSTEHVWLNTGNGWLQDDAFAAGISSVSTNNFLEFADLNGDGVPDIIALSTNPSSDEVYLGKSTPSNVLITVNNGLGGTTQVTYAFSPPPITAGIRLPPVTVVQSITTSDGISGDAVMISSYSFSGGLFDASRPNREFLGFSQVTSTDAQGNYLITYFLQTQNAVNGVNLYAGMTSEEDQYDSSGNLLTRSTYTVSYSMPFAGVYFPFVSEADTYIGPKHSAIGYVYDSSGNVTEELDYGDVSATGDERTIATSYSTGSTGPYLLGYPILKQVYAGVGTSGQLLSRTSFFYDGAYTTAPALGELTKVDNWLSGGQDPIVVSSYDVYGNLTDTYDALYNASGGSQGNHTQTIYETTFYQYPESIQQGVGSSLNMPAETYVYDPGTGQMLSHVDVNGSTTSYSYDVFGRLSTVVGPADQVTPSSPTLSYQYNLSTSPPQSIVTNSRIIQGSSLTLTTYAFFDGLGRQMETKTTGPAGTQIVNGAVLYNSLGQAATAYVPATVSPSDSYVPFNSGQPHSVTTYDALSRVIEVVNPDNTISTRAYQGWTETDTDANGHSKTYMKNAYGQIVQVDEQYSTSTYATFYQYDLLGNLINTINSLGQATTVYYDTLSRKTEMIDPQMGTWQYQYDANGNLTQQTDSKNQIVTMTYDPLNRRLSKVYPDSTSLSYSYDSGAFAEGKLSSVTDLSGSQQFAYDSNGNVLSKTRTIAGNVYVTSMTYDDLNRETSVTYPDGATVNESYDASALSVVQSTSGLSYATLSYSMTAPMKISGVEYGNGMSSQYAYDPAMFRLTNLSALASGTTIQNFSYQYDNVGNITRIVDSVNLATQTFSYDPLDRLSQAVGPYGTNSYAYDSIGTLTLNSDDSSGFWNFDDTSSITSIFGLVVSTNGRIGAGLSFDGASEASINGSSIISPPGTMTVALWLRPKALGSSYAVSKSSSFYFPQIEADGSLDATLELSSGQQTVHVSSVSLFNLWSYFVMTYDGSAINIYVNGQLWQSQSATGTIQTSTQPIILGDGFTGSIDELSVYPWALSASEVLRRYELYPSLAISQPYTPNSVPGGMTAGVVNTTYTFTFQAWDLNGNALQYLINWGDGNQQNTSYVASGAAVQSTHTWTSTGTYSVTVQALEPSTSSVWSPSCNILIVSTAIHTALGANLLIGASANFATFSGRLSSATAGEALTGLSSSTVNIGHFGYQGVDIAPNSTTAEYLGQQGLGGADAAPAPELPASDLVAYSTWSVPISTISLNLLEHGSTTFTDANGNLQVENGRWIAYDFENRPVAVVTIDQVLDQFTYDFEGHRTLQTVMQPSQAAKTTIYVGGIYQVMGSNATKYITTGPLRVAKISTIGTTTYFLPDHLSSTNLLVDNNLNTVRAMRYMPFGSTYQSSGTEDDDHKFTGQQLDDITGLYYYVGRYYDPVFGTFVTPDPLTSTNYDPQALNRYTYVRNNPLAFTDPTGYSFFGNIGNFFSNLGSDIGREHGEGFLFFGIAGLIPQVNAFAFRNRYYLAAAALTAATYGAGVGLAAGTWGATIAQGALSGEVFGGISGGLQGGNGQAAFLGTVEGGITGAASAGAMHGIEDSDLYPFMEIPAKAAVSGGLARLQGENFMGAFEMEAIFATMAAGYQAYEGDYPTAAPATQEVSQTDYSENGTNNYNPNGPIPQQNVNVFGSNSGGPCPQGGSCSNAFNNYFPGANATAHLHDFYLNVNGLQGPGVPSMLPAYLFSTGSLLGNDWSGLVPHLER